MTDIPPSTLPIGLTRLPSLDGWRAISIFVVLAGHSELVPGFPNNINRLHHLNLHTVFQWLFDPNLGVRCFFVISGLLITWLMLQENGRLGHVHLGHFYARRAFRILPVFLAFLCVLAVLQAVTPFTMSSTMWVVNLTFMTNYFWTCWPTGHLWSLSVEEQFYLLWPFLFRFFEAGTRTKFGSILWPLGVAVLLSPLVRALGYMRVVPSAISPLVSWCSLLSAGDSLALGCIAAVCLHDRAAATRSALTTRPRLVGLVALAMVVIPHLLRRLSLLDILTVPLGNTLQGIGLTVLILQSVILPDWGIYTVLNWSLVAWIGTLSYSLYIWQQLFCTSPDVFGLPVVWWLSFPGWLLPTVLTALVSYYGLEKPFLRLRARLRTAP